MGFLKYFIIFMFFAVVAYYSVDDKTRTKIDYGMENQRIETIDMKNRVYLVLWEFFGAHDDEIARQKEIYAAELGQQRKILNQKIMALEGQRAPAQDETRKFDKFLAK